jgi:hypothetical protein
MLGISFSEHFYFKFIPDPELSGAGMMFSPGSVSGSGSACLAVILSPVDTARIAERTVHTTVSGSGILIILSVCIKRTTENYEENHERSIQKVLFRILEP